jgi:hypothetical protein
MGYICRNILCTVVEYLCALCPQAGVQVYVQAGPPARPIFLCFGYPPNTRQFLALLLSDRLDDRIRLQLFVDCTIMLVKEAVETFKFNDYIGTTYSKMRVSLAQNPKKNCGLNLSISYVKFSILQMSSNDPSDSPTASV